MKRANSLGGAPQEGARPEWMGCERGNRLGGAPLEGARPECRTSVDGLQSVEIAWGERRAAGMSETGLMLCEEKIRRKERDGRVWTGCEAWK